MQVIWCKRRFETMQIDWRTNIQIWLVKIQENDIKVGVVSLLKALSIYIVHTLFLFSLWMFQLNILMPAGRHPTPQIDGQPSDFLETLHIHPERRSGSSFITLHLAPPWSWRPSISTTTLLKFMWLTRWSTLKPANFEAREGSAHELLFLVGFILQLWMSCWLRRANLRWRLVGLACLEMLLCKTTTTLSQDSRMKLDYDMRREVEK